MIITVLIRETCYNSNLGVSSYMKNMISVGIIHELPAFRKVKVSSRTMISRFNCLCKSIMHPKERMLKLDVSIKLVMKQVKKVKLFVVLTHVVGTKRR
jgi:hypothetical protein